MSVIFILNVKKCEEKTMRIIKNSFVSICDSLHTSLHVDNNENEMHVLKNQYYEQVNTNELLIVLKYFYNTTIPF